LARTDVTHVICVNGERHVARYRRRADNNSDLPDAWYCKAVGSLDYDRVLDAHTHYTSPDARHARTIFGGHADDLEYNYSDRLRQWDHEKSDAAFEHAATVATPKTARFYQAMLAYYHGQPVELRHIMAGCNLSTGFDYLVFGYRLLPASDTATEAQAPAANVAG